MSPIPPVGHSTGRPIPPVGRSTGRPHPRLGVKEIDVVEEASGEAPAKAKHVSRLVVRMENAVNTAARFEVDPLLSVSSSVFSDAVMAESLPLEVYQRFKECLVTGEPTPVDDQKIIAEVMFEWARGLGAVDFAHWFFPLRGGGGAVGGQISALKMDTLIDLDWSSDSSSKPFKGCLPHERLFQGETDGSSFPNGGLRSTHVAAAFTTWDRTSPPFVLGGVLRIPCSFVTHLGRCIDDKTPLLRSFGALQQHGMRLLKTLSLAPGARTVHSYLGWEQEFFVVPAEAYKRRPDLVNCGRTLIGKLPPRNQQAELNYFGPVPHRVEELLRRVQTTMLEVGCPMSVKHNEVAPGQHEMSPIFSVANVSADSNVLFMEVCNQEAAKLGLQVLFHEKPFAGINGSGKHANWSIGTDTGINFFHPGKTAQTNALFVTAIACLAHGLSQHNELVRCAVAHAGNDHRLGAQEAPPAIISLYPGVGFEEHVDSIIAGGPLIGYSTETKPQSTGSAASMAVKANAEDRNRTAPFPFCGNRFEFRAVGSSQNCAFPIMICNTVMASGMAHMNSLLESGMCHRDAVAKVFKESKHVIFTGNGYSKVWPFEAEGRGLPNLNTTPKALATWASPKNKATLAVMGVYTEEETEARAEVMYEAYVTTLKVEVETMLHMVRTGIIPACTRDMQKYRDFPRMAGRRLELYQSIIQETDALDKLAGGSCSCGELHAEATYLCDVVRNQMDKLRKLVDEAEGVLEAGLYPFPSYEALLYSHHH